MPPTPEDVIAEIRRHAAAGEDRLERMYHVVVVVDDPPPKGWVAGKSYMTRTPVTHNEGCTIMNKMTKWPQRMITLEEVG